MTTTTIPLHDDRETSYIVQTIRVSTGQCNAEHGSCGKPGIVAVRNTISQERPAESSAYRVTLCADHQDGAAHMHDVWVADARKLQDPDQRAEFLAGAGVVK